MSRLLYRFRKDLRLRDQRCFTRACDQADSLLPSSALALAAMPA